MSNPNHVKWLPPIRRIQEQVCQAFDITITQLKSARRAKPLIAPRHIAMWLCCKLTTASLPAIGAAFGGRDHTTVIHAKRNAEFLMAFDQGLREKTEAIVRGYGDEKVTG